MSGDIDKDWRELVVSKVDIQETEIDAERTNITLVVWLGEIDFAFPVAFVLERWHQVDTYVRTEMAPADFGPFEVTVELHREIVRVWERHEIIERIGRAQLSEFLRACGFDAAQLPSDTDELIGKKVRFAAEIDELGRQTRRHFAKV